jgi:hypothetical protein
MSSEGRQVIRHKRNAGDVFRSVAQGVAILMLAGILGMLLHKGHADFSALAKEHPDQGFWPALVRYVFRNLAG